MRVKCIGGRRDGALIDIPDKGFSRDIYVPVLKPLSVTILSSDQISSSDKELYELDYFTFPGTKHLYFLRYHELSMIEMADFLIQNHNRDGEK